MIYSVTTGGYAENLASFWSAVLAPVQKLSASISERVTASIDMLVNANRYYEENKQLKKQLGEIYNDMIDYDKFICRKILPSLRYWIRRKDRFGYPVRLSSKEEWDNILEEILWAVEEAAYGTEEDKASAAGADYDELKKIWDREKNGLELFGKFVQGMWD